MFVLIMNVHLVGTINGVHIQWINVNLVFYLTL
jgi:hypothetical protein